MSDDFSVKDALTNAAVKLRTTVASGNEVLSPTGSQPIQIDPVLGTYFGIENPDATTEMQVNQVTQWLKDNGYTDSDQMTTILSQIEMRLGDNSHTQQDRLEKIYKYIRLRQQSKLLTRQADAMMK